MLSDDTLALIGVAAQAALDKKAFQVVALDLSQLTSFTDSFLIASGAHLRQVGAIAEEVDLRLRARGRRPLHVEGTGQSEWVLLDYGDFIVHLLTEERRRYYALEALWGDAPRIPAPRLGVEEAGTGEAPSE